MSDYQHGHRQYAGEFSDNTYLVCSHSGCQKKVRPSGSNLWNGKGDHDCCGNPKHADGRGHRPPGYEHLDEPYVPPPTFTEAALSWIDWLTVRWGNRK